MISPRPNPPPPPPPPTISPLVEPVPEDPRALELELLLEDDDREELAREDDEEELNRVVAARKADEVELPPPEAPLDEDVPPLPPVEAKEVDPEEELEPLLIDALAEVDEELLTFWVAAVLTAGIVTAWRPRKPPRIRGALRAA